MKKKILFVINSLECGGAEKSLVSLLSAMDFNKYEVDLLMFRPQGMFLKLLPPEVTILDSPEYFTFLKEPRRRQMKNVKFCITRLKVSIELRRKHGLHDAQVFWKQAHNAFKTILKRYDAAIAWGQGNPTHFVAEKVQANKKIAVINVNYGAAGYKKEFDFPFYRQFASIATVSDDLNERIVRAFTEMREKIHTLYDINNASMASMENYINIDPTIVAIVTVGRLTRQKGYDLATRACAYLKNKNIAFRWYIVGDGPERRHIEEDIKKYGIQEYMALVGAQENPYVYMKNADVYVQTSRFEGYCLTLCEARILNVPIVSTNFDVVYDQIMSGENGLIVDMEPEAIAEGIIRMLTDTELRKHVIETLMREKKGNPEEIEKFYQLLEGEDG